LVSPTSSVVVIEKDGIARAHPDSQILRPHLAGNEEGLDGENVVMTYCAMADLSLEPHDHKLAYNGWAS